MSIDNTFKTEDLSVFIEKAKSFCSFLETQQGEDHKAFLSDIEKQLIWLYRFGQTLPEFHLPIGKDIEYETLSGKDIKDLLSFIRNRLRDPFYWTVFDPTDHSDTTSCCGDLVDDLSDIYKDLKDFLTNYEHEDEDVRLNAIWHLKWSFDNHWNDHSIDAIYAIHYFLKRCESE